MFITDIDNYINRNEGWRWWSLRKAIHKLWSALLNILTNWPSVFKVMTSKTAPPQEAWLHGARCGILPASFLLKWSWKFYLRYLRNDTQYSVANLFLNGQSRKRELQHCPVYSAFFSKTSKSDFLRLSLPLVILCQDRLSAHVSFSEQWRRRGNLIILCLKKISCQHSEGPEAAGSGKTCSSYLV